MDTQAQLSQAFETLKQRIDTEAFKNVNRTMLLLQQELRKLYIKKSTVSGGLGGSLGGIVTSVTVGSNGITATIGFSHQADFLKYREFGVLPAMGATYPAHSKIPPPPAIYAWLSKSGIAIPEKFKNAKDPQMSFAVAIAFSIRSQGQKPLRLMQAILKLQSARIKQLMQGQ